MTKSTRLFTVEMCDYTNLSTDEIAKLIRDAIVVETIKLGYCVSKCIVKNATDEDTKYEVENGAITEVLPQFDNTSQLTGGDSNYYLIPVTNPKRDEIAPYVAEVEDLIESMRLSFAEGNILKSLVRRANRRMGNGKPGNIEQDCSMYDIEKVVHYAMRELEKELRGDYDK